MAADPNRLEMIFAAALAYASPQERAAYCDRACAGDPELRRRVQVLLQAHDDAGSFLEKPAAAEEALTIPPAGRSALRDSLFAPTEGPGTRIGPYKLLQQIGEGGMGAVFMAEQEQPVRRRVALKIIRPGMDSGQVIARFEAERQALALMDHPNIAKVLDAGTTESGRPYFVMELVHGVPLTKFCDDGQLTPRQRLELFVPICHAIQHAHQKGIIHRDIKPSNVLVTMHDDKPVPKVIDFGVAKAIEQRLTEKTLFTQFGALVGTLEYVSPEQAEMNAFGVDTRSDVYSLGVLLYELLTGTTPLDRRRLRDAAYTELLRLIKEEEPPRPSVRLSSSGDLPKIAAARRTEATRLPGLLRGEIDWIVMKCLEKDRTRRYDSASALARDVERHLRDEPVEACPPSVVYRLRKFTRKNRVVLATAAAFAALLLIAAGVSTWLAVAATEAKHEADEQRKHAEEKELETFYYLGVKNTALRVAQNEKAAAKASAAQTRRALDRLTVAKGIQLAEQSNLFEALPWLVKPLERGGLTPEEEKVHRARVACYLRYTRGRPTLRHILFHGEPVSLPALSPDARRVLTVGNKNVYVWDVRSGKSIATLPHPEAVTSAQFTPDGTRILTIAGAAVRTWNARSGRNLGPCLGDWKAFLAQPLALLPHSPQQLLGMVGAQELADGKWHWSERYAEFSGDGRRVLFSYRRVLSLWDIEARKPIREWLRGADGLGDDHALSPDGQSLLLIRDGHLSVNEGATGRPGSRLLHHRGPVASVAFSPDGTRALAVGKDGTAQVWDAKTWKLVARMRAPDSGLRSYGRFSPDNRFVVFWGFSMVGRFRNMAWWDVESGRLVHAIADRGQDVQALGWRPDSRQLLRASRRDVALWDVSSPGGPAALLPFGSPVNAAVFGSDARTLLTATEDSAVYIWDLAGFNERFPLNSAEGDAFSTSMQLSRVFEGGSRQYTEGTSWEGITWLDLTGIQRLLTPGTHFFNGALSPDRSRVLTAHFKPRCLQLWNARTGRPVGKPLRTNSHFTFAAFSPDTRLVVVAENEGPTRLIDARNGEPVGKPLVHGGTVFYAAFSPDAKLLVTCGDDHTARLWRTRTGRPVGKKLRHADVVLIAAFSANGRRVATGSLDGIVRLWDERGAPLGMLKCKSGHARGLMFHPSGLLRIVSSKGTMRLWEVAPWQEASPAIKADHLLGVYGVSYRRGDTVSALTVMDRPFRLPRDLRPTGDLVKLGQLYSGQRLDANGSTVPLRPEERQAIWRELSARYPEEFSVTAEAGIAWRVKQVERASRRKQHAEVAFGRRWLAAELAESGWQPGDPGSAELAVTDYLQRLCALAQFGPHAAAAAAADALAARWSKNAEKLYNCACVLALAAGATKSDAALADRYAARAVALLRQAVKAGWTDGEQIRKDPDLDALRGRKDFVRFLRGLKGTC
jgi:serine/threonine protein kinase/WD40 repeat protein